MIDLPYVIKIWGQKFLAFYQFTRLTDRRTDIFVIANNTLHSMQCAVKSKRMRATPLPPDGGVPLGAFSKICMEVSG